jgi:hypothetical protein
MLNNRKMAPPMSAPISPTPKLPQRPKPCFERVTSMPTNQPASAPAASQTTI